MAIYTLDYINEASYKLYYFFDDPYFARYKTTLSDAQKLLKDNDITLDKGKKRMRKALEIINITLDYTNAAALGLSIGGSYTHRGWLSKQMKITIPLYTLAFNLISPVISWAIRSHNESICISQGEEAIRKMDKLIDSIEDGDTKNKMIKKKEELEQKLKECKQGHEDTSLLIPNPKLFSKKKK